MRMMQTIKKFMLLGLVLLLANTVQAEEKKAKAEKTTAPAAKALSGMSIVGNDEAPKALYLVPWKSSEIGQGATLEMPERREYTPVDREEFERKVNYYYVSTIRNTGR